MTPLPIAHNTLRRLLLSTAAPLVIGLALAGQAQAQNTPTPDNPGGWTNVTPGTTVGNNSSVTVTGNRAYATWLNFNVIGGTFTVNGQINPTWILVNRVTGTDASMISGTIQANGQFWLINQNGITATSSAVFDVGGLLLSTASVFDPNVFQSGVTNWNFDDALAGIVMNGTVNATGGVVAFIAPDVSVGGRINEGAGSAEVLMLAARSASLTFSDVDGDLIYELNNVTVTRGALDARVAVGTGAAVTADRIVVGAVGNGSAGRILISGALNATGARGDGRDIVLTVPDETTGFAGPAAERVIYGAAVPVAPTTTTGGTITLNDGAAFSTAAGGGMEVSAAGNVTFGAITTALDDLDVLATGDFASGALAVRRDALVAAGGAVTTGGVTAGRDVSLVGTSVTAGALSGGRDVLVRALTGDVTLVSAAAVDDLWIEAAESITTGALTAGTGADALGVADRPGAGMFGGAVDQTGGGDIVVRAGEDLTIGNATAAGLGGDVRVRSATGAATTGAVTAGADIAVDATAVTTGALSAGRDIGLRAQTGDLTLGSARAGDDIVLRGARITAGALTSDGVDNASAGQSGDLLSGLDPFTLDGSRSVAGGADVDVRATDAIATGAVSAGRDARLQTSATIAAGAVSAGRDVLLDATEVAAGALTAGRDVAAWARTGTLTTGAIAAGDDVVLRAPGLIQVNGGITAGGGADAAGEGDLLATLAPATMFGTARDLIGADVDLASGAGLTVTGAVATTGAESDVRANAVDGISLGGASAGRNVSLDGPSIATGALSAGRDVAAWARTGTLTTGAITAGDDVVLRAPGVIQVNGGITAGGGTDAAGDGDVVATLAPATMFGTARDLAGADVDLSSGAGLTVTGVVATTGTESDVRANAVDGINLGGASAGRDVSLDGPTIVTGALSAGRDVAAWARTGTLTTGGITAGDDVVLRAPGAGLVNGGITAGGAADAAGDGDLVATLSPSAMFGTLRDLTGSDVDLSSGAGLTVTGAVATTGAESDVRVNAVAGIALGGASAGRDVSLDGPGIVTGALSAGRDVAAWARTGTLTTGAIAAGDDVVLRAPGAIQVSGGITAGSGADAAGDGDVVAALSPSAMFGALNALTGGDVDLSSGAGLTVTGAIATTGSESDVRANAAQGIALGGASAGRDVSLDGPTIATGALSAGRDVAAWARTGTLTSGGITAGDDVVLRAPGLIQVNGGITAGGGADAAGDGDVVAALSPSAMFGTLRDLTGSDVDLASGAGVTVTGAVATTGAESDLRVNAVDGISLAGASAGRDVSLNGPTIVTGALSAGRDLAAWARTGTLTTGAITAGDDVVLRAPGAILVNGGITAGGGADAAGDGDLVAALSPSAMFGTVRDLTGADVDLASGAGLTVTGAVAATGAEADVRANAVGGITVDGVSAGRDVSLDGPSIATGALSAGRDVAAWARTGTLTSGGITAGDDVVLRAPGLIQVNGGITAGGGADAAGDGDVVAALSPSAMFGTLRDLTGSDVDLASGAGVTVTGAVATTGAESDLRVNAVDGISLAGASAGRDVSLNGPTIVTGALSAGRDLAAWARTGTLTTGAITAGDDVVLRAPGAILVNGGITAGGGADAAGDGDLVAALSPSAMFGTVRDLTGADVDLASGAGLTVTGAVAATGAEADVRANAVGGITVDGVSAGRDVSLDGPTIVTGALSAGRDVAAWARTGTLTTGGITAGDDVVLRAPGAVLVNGGITAGGAADAAGDGDVLAMLAPATMFGTVRDLTGADVDLSSGAGLTVTGSVATTGVESDVRANAVGGINLGGASAGRDVSLDGPAVVTGGLSAGRDVAVWARTGGLTTGGIVAGDDLVFRAFGPIQINGGISAGGGADAAGDADALAAVSGAALFGMVRDLTGADIDLSSGARPLAPLDTTVTVTGAVTATGGQSDFRVFAGGAIALSDASAGGDLTLDGWSVAAGDLSAGRDVAAQARGVDLILASARAGDDVVLRAQAGSLLITGALAAGNGADAMGDGDVLAGWTSSSVFGVLNDLAGGSDVDIAARDTIEVRGGTSALGTGSDVRASTDATVGQAVLMADVRAGRDVSLDGARVAGGAIAAGRDVAIRGRTGAVALGSVNAGDDVVLRAVGGAGTVTVAGGLTTTGVVDQAGTGDLLAALSPAALFGVTHGVTGSDIDVRATDAVTVGGVSDAGGTESDVRLQGAALTTGNIEADGDIGIDAGSLVAGTMTAARDVAVRTLGGLGAAGISAGDDVVLRAGGDLQVTGAVLARGTIDGAGTGQDLAALAPPSLFGVTHDLSGSDIDIAAGGGVAIGGAVTATGTGSDVRVRGAVVDLADVSAGRDIGIDGTSVAADALTAGRDAALRASAGAMTIASVSARDDIVLRASGAFTVSGALSATGAIDEAGVGDVLAGLAPAGLFGVTGTLAGSDIDIAAGAVTVGGATTATGLDGDVRVQTTAGTGLGIQMGAITAGRDIGLDGASVSAGAIGAGRDVALRARGGNLALASISAADDIVLRASGAVTTSGTLTASGGGDGSGVADALATLAPASLFGSTAALTGSDIDVSGSAVTLAGATGATGDVRVQATGAVQAGAITAGGDVGVDGASVSAGAIGAGRDVALRARSGNLTLASITAADDIVLRASGAVTTSGILTASGGGDASGVADALAALAPASLFGSTTALTGSDIDVSGSAVTLGGATGATGATGDVRVQATGAVQTGAITAGGDVGLDGASVSAGAIGAGRDVGLRARSGNLTLASITAADDIVLRASGAVTASGALSASGGVDGAGVADALNTLAPNSLFGSTAALTGSDIDISAASGVVSGAIGAAGAGSDVRVRTTAGLELGAVTAGGDIGLDAASVTAAALSAGRDVAARAGSGDLRLASVSAGDDIVLRASGAMAVTGTVASTGVSDEAGTGDALRPLNPGTSLIALTGRASAGSDIDILGGSISLNGVSTTGTGSDVRLETSGSTRGLLQVAGPITASGTGSSVLIHGGDTRLGPVTARALRLAGSDIALNGAVSVVGDMDVFADTGGTVVLGGASGTGSFRLDNSEMQRVSAGRFSLFASTPLTATTRTTSGNVVVDTLELRPSLNSVAVYVNGQRIDVVGAVTGAGGSFTLGSAVPIEGFDWRPSVVRVSGSIGTPAARLGGVSLNGDNIFIAPREGTSTAGQPDAFEQGLTPITAYQGGPGLIAPGGVQIAADTLTLRARDRILQRNLQGDPRNLSDGRGFDVGSLIVDRLGTTDLTTIDLFGLFRAPGVPVISGVGAALTVQFGGTGPFRINYVPTAAETIDGYRLNTCILGAGGGCAVFLAPFSQPPLADPDELGDLTDPYAIVDDEPVTSSGGEILWPAPGDRRPADEEDEDE